jgi:hypothetical protein
VISEWSRPQDSLINVIPSGALYDRSRLGSDLADDLEFVD